MASLAQGEPGAVRPLFDRHAPTLLALAGRVLRDRHEAEEVVNEVFLELWQNARRFDPARSAPRTYLILLTRSRAIDRARAGTRRRRQGAWPQAEPADAAAGPPSESAERDELRRAVRHALGALPEDHRGAVALSFLDGLTHEQIAAATGTPLGTVKGRIRRGLLRMRDVLRGHFEAEQIGLTTPHKPNGNGKPNSKPNGRPNGKPDGEARAPAHNDQNEKGGAS